MSFINDFRTEDYGSDFFDVPDGRHEIKVDAVEVKQSKNGKRMIEVKYACRDNLSVHYVENYVEGEYFNKNMSRLFDAFCIPQGDFNFNNWIGKKCFAEFYHKEETYEKNGEQRTINKCRIKYLVVPKVEQKPQQFINNYQKPQTPPAQSGSFNEDIPF